MRTQNKSTWKKVTPIPPEFNGHTFLFECKKCHKVTHYCGKEDLPPYECKNCKERKGEGD